MVDRLHQRYAALAPKCNFVGDQFTSSGFLQKIFKMYYVNRREVSVIIFEPVEFLEKKYFLIVMSLS